MMLADRIIFEDGEALVIDKPPDGGASRPFDAAQPGGSPAELRLGFQREPSPVHRLDRDTSGCLLLARHPKAHKRFAAEFEAGRVPKTYLASSTACLRGGGRYRSALAKCQPRGGWRMVPDRKGTAAVSAGGWWPRRRAALVRFSPRNRPHPQLRVTPPPGSAPDPRAIRLRRAGLRDALTPRLRLARGDKPPVAAAAPLPRSFANAGFGDVEL
jgi:tRNA pseudouridine32 synthase/23S rRNA pseudouridine746 synthase